MPFGLPILDATLEATPWKSPPTSPVRSYVGDLTDSPLRTHESSRFVDWEPGMLTVQPEAALELGDLPSFPDFEAALANSPLARRLATPKGGLVVLATDELPAAEDLVESPQDLDMKQFAEEYEQIQLDREASMMPSSS